MDITEFLETPDGAVLAAIGGEVTLVTMRHENANKVTIERFPLGAVAGVDAVLQLLGTHGFSNREPALTATPALPTVDDRPYACTECTQRFARKDSLTRHRQRVHGHGVGSASHLCPECGQGFARTQGLGVHRKAAHGVASAGPPRSAPGDYACPECEQTFAKKRALGMHRLRVHGVHREPRRAPVSGEHQCATCEARFETEIALDMHQMKVHRVPPPSALMAAAVAAPDDSASILPPPSVSLDVAPASESPMKPERQKPAKTAMIADGTCPVCHEPLVTHEQCDGCDVFIGPSHATMHGMFISGGIYCRDCAETRIAARRAELVAA
jgi:hypothetical protein